MDKEKFIQLCLHINEDAKIFRNEIELSNGNIDIVKIDDWVNENLNKVLMVYNLLLNTDDEEILFHKRYLVNQVFNKTYFRKYRLQKMIKNGGKFEDACKTILITFERLNYWTNKFKDIDWVYFSSEFSVAATFIRAKKIEECIDFLGRLKKKQDLLEGDAKREFNYRIEDQLELFIKDKNEIILHRLYLQYYFWTLHFIKKGYTLFFPTLIKKGNEETYGGEYPVIINLLESQDKLNIIDNFNLLYKEILSETDFSSFIERFKSEIFR
ncbi:MAG: hypothetical protein MUP85_16655 [Candidatus Lokiarchaeota archaeon]|nr:hypothetical protein [Candidatus Lokiarchaeota archaeon]